MRELAEYFHEQSTLGKLLCSFLGSEFVHKPRNTLAQFRFTVAGCNHEPADVIAQQGRAILLWVVGPVLEILEEIAREAIALRDVIGSATDIYG